MAADTLTTRARTVSALVACLLVVGFCSCDGVQAQVRLRSDEALTPSMATLREEILGQDREVFQLDCTNAYLRRDVSLFGNGMIRVREGYVTEPEMWLAEIDLDSTAALIAQLQIPDLSGVADNSRTVVGDWVENCVFTLSLPGEEQRVFNFKRLDSLSLPLQKALAVAITTLGMVDRSLPPDPEGRLFNGYIPKRGDILVTSNGAEFRVSGFANNGAAIEVVGVDQPVVQLIAIRDLARQFERLKDDP